MHIVRKCRFCLGGGGDFYHLGIKVNPLRVKTLRKYFFFQKIKTKFEIVELLCTDPAKYECLKFRGSNRFLCHTNLS